MQKQPSLTPRIRALIEKAKATQATDLHDKAMEMRAAVGTVQADLADLIETLDGPTAKQAKKIHDLLLEAFDDLDSLPVVDESKAMSAIEKRLGCDTYTSAGIFIEYRAE